MEFSRQEYWSGFPFSSPGNLLNPDLPHFRQILSHLSHCSLPPSQISPNYSMHLLSVSPGSNPRWVNHNRQAKTPCPFSARGSLRETVPSQAFVVVDSTAFHHTVGRGIGFTCPNIAINVQHTHKIWGEETKCRITNESIPLEERTYKPINYFNVSRVISPKKPKTLWSKDTYMGVSMCFIYHLLCIGGHILRHF